MNLILTWTSPALLPSCGFTIHYRRNYDPAYITVSTSGTTSGNTYSIPILEPASYEGYIQSNCCADNLSTNLGFGVNAYSPLILNIVGDPDRMAFAATVHSSYGNPYDTLLAGSFVSTRLGVPTTINYTFTYPANSTTYTQDIGEGVLPVPGTISNIIISTIAPIFDQGGSLQQYDSVNTPPYFQFYNGATSGITWNGSPLTLSSFILREFNVTTQSPGGDPLAGNLLISWIAPPQYGGDNSPYNEVILKVYDATDAFMGNATAFPVQGFYNLTIALEKAVSTIGPGTEFTMTSEWGDGTVTATKLFYLPLF